jgi:hypothetical protein
MPPLTYKQSQDDLQIPKTLRPKLTIMDATVKAAMLKSSQIPMFQVPPPSTAPASATGSHFAYPQSAGAGGGPITPPPPQTPSRSLRRTRSSDSIPSPRAATDGATNPVYQQQPQAGTGIPQTAAPSASGFFHPPSSHHARHATATTTGAPSSSAGSVLGSPAYHARGKSSVTLASFATGEFITGKGYGKGSGIAGGGSGAAKGLAPARFVSLLNGSSSTQLELESVKKLRMMLRNESARWESLFPFLLSSFINDVIYFFF